MELGDALESAIQRVITTQAQLKPRGAPGHEASLIDHLQATVHHLAVLAVAQAQQYESLSEELAQLRGRIDALQQRPLH